MNYKTIKETALRWGVAERTVNKFCTQGRIEGAKKFGTTWAIPEDAEKPDDPRRERKRRSAIPSIAEEVSEIVSVDDEPQAEPTRRIAMPLLSTPFKPGECLTTIEQIEDADTRNIALAEYYYFSGQSEKVAEFVEPYLMHEDIALRISARWLSTYANLVVGKVLKTRNSLELINQMVESLREDTPLRERAYAISASTGTAVLLHLPVPKILDSLQTYIHMMPSGLRLFVLYIQAHHAYLSKYYGTAIGIAETALALESELYPIPTIYLHLIACVGYLNMKHPEHAKAHFLKAWEIAQPDDFIHPIAEHHGLVGGTLEATLKRMFPNDFKRIIALTYKFSSGWRKVHNSITGHTVPDDLTTSEYAAAMLAAQGWTNQEIADHMGVSENTVKTFINMTFQKLNITQRKDLGKCLLR